jgi:hypothetical protein
MGLPERPGGQSPVPDEVRVLAEDLARQDPITVGATLQDVLDAVAASDGVPGELRKVAAQVRTAAEVVWSRYGGDSGGW